MIYYLCAIIRPILSRILSKVEYKHEHTFTKVAVAAITADTIFLCHVVTFHAFELHVFDHCWLLCLLCVTCFHNRTVHLTIQLCISSADLLQRDLL